MHKGTQCYQVMIYYILMFAFLNSIYIQHQEGIGVFV